VVPVPTLTYDGYAAPAPMYVDPSWDEDARDAARRYVASLEGRLREQGMGVTSDVVIARSVAETIVARAEERSSDMIVMSSQALTGAARALFGSVADAVMRKAHCPVLIAHRPAEDDSITAAEKAVATPVSVEQAVDSVKAFPATKFDSSVELIFSLGIDPKQADQMIRSSLSLPHGIGKSKRVIAFCPEHLVETAKAAGAVRAGGQDLVQEIEKTNFSDFDVAIASPDMMRFVGRLGKVLGPKGLMPSPKAGTVTPDIANAVKEYAAGKVEFRNDSGGNVHSVVGKVSFDKGKLVDNINAMIGAVRKLKPQTSKGHYFKKVVLKATMTPAVQIVVQL